MPVSVRQFVNEREAFQSQIGQFSEQKKKIVLIWNSEIDDKQADDLEKLLRTHERKLHIYLDFLSTKIPAAEVPFNPTGIERFPNAFGINMRYCWNAKSFDFLSSFKNLKVLSIDETKSKKISLDVLSELKQLRFLSLTKQANGIHEIQRLPNLEQLELIGSTFENLLFLEDCSKKLWSLRLGYGATSNLTGLEITNLKMLDLWKIKQLTTLTPLSDLVTLEILELRNLPHLNALPDFSRLDKLRSLSIEANKSLHDLSPLRSASNLEVFYCSDCGHMRPQDFEILNDHSNMRYGGIGMGSKSKNAIVAQLLPLKEPRRRFKFADGSTIDYKLNLL